MKTSLGSYSCIEEEKDKVEVLFNGSIDKGKYGKEKEEENNKEKSLPRLNPVDSCEMEHIFPRFLKSAKKRFPILTWLKTYILGDCISDAIAGITVGLTVIPQGIAYAAVAGLDAQYGLYSAFMGCFVYCIFGTSKVITIGPTSVMALMTQANAKLGPDYAVLLAFFSGIITLSLGILQLGFLVDFISAPVISGFTSAASVKVITGQTKALLGLTIGEKSQINLGIVDEWIDIFTYIKTIRYTDAILGIGSLVLLLSLRALNRVAWFKSSQHPSPGIQTWFNNLPSSIQNVMSKCIWFCSTSRNSLVVISCAVMAGYIDQDCIDIMKDKNQGLPVNGSCVWRLTGSIQEGLPAFHPPPFSTLSSNNETVSFGEMATEMGSAIILVPLIAILQHIAIVKAFAGGKPVDASQELIALGCSNMLGSFVRSMPTTGSFSRSAVNSNSGVRTPLGGVFTGLIIVLCLAVLIPYCAFIPKATLAAVIISALIFNLEYHVLIPMWKSKKIDLMPALTCFFVCVLYDIEMGILAGVVIQLILLLYHTARPRILVQLRKVPGSELEYLYIAPEQSIMFPAVTYVWNLINKASFHKASSAVPVVIDCTKLNQIDYTTADVFKSILEDFSSRRTDVYWLNPVPHVAHTITVLAKDRFRPIYGDLSLTQLVLKGNTTAFEDDSNTCLLNTTPQLLNGNPQFINGNPQILIHSPILLQSTCNNLNEALVLVNDIPHLHNVVNNQNEALLEIKETKETKDTKDTIDTKDIITIEATDSVGASGASAHLADTSKQTSFNSTEKKEDINSNIEDRHQD